MSRTERREYTAGVLAAVILASALVLTAFANRQSVSLDDGLFRLTADFGQADGIYVGSPIRAAGIVVGTVSRMSLNAQNRAVLTLQFDNYIPLTEGAFAKIETDGIFGSKHVELDPGGDDTLLKAGEHISATQDSQILEEVIAGIVDRARAASNADAKND